MEPGRGVWAGDRVGNIYIVTKTVEVKELSLEEGPIGREWMSEWMNEMHNLLWLALAKNLQDEECCGKKEGLNYERVLPPNPTLQGWM